MSLTGATKAELVLLHGWGFNSLVWDPFKPLLAPAWNIHAPDYCGGTAAATTFEAMVQYALDAAPARATWVGWSLGGLVALAAAAAAPDRVSGLVLIAATPRFVAGPDWPHAVHADRFRDFRDELSSDPARALRRFTALCARGSAGTVAVARQLAAAAHSGTRPSRAALEAGLRSLESLDLRARIAELRCPLRFVFGDEDPLIPPQVADRLRAMRPDTDVVVVAGAGHVPFLSHGPLCAGWINAR